LPATPATPARIRDCLDLLLYRSIAELLFATLDALEWCPPLSSFLFGLENTNSDFPLVVDGYCLALIWLGLLIVMVADYRAVFA